MVEPVPDDRLAGLRLLAGFVIVPPIAVLIALVTYDRLWHAGLFPHGAPIHSLDSAESLGSGVAILAIVVTFGGVVPGVLWLKSRGTLTLRKLLILGAVLGNVPFLLILVGIVVVNVVTGTFSADIGQYWEGLSGAMIRTGLGLICGMGSAAAFWLVAVFGTTR